MNSPLKKAHLPSASLGISFRPDAIQSSYAHQTANGIYETRLNLLVRCIGPSRHPQAGGYDSSTRSARSNVHPEYASARGIFVRLAAGTFLIGLGKGFFSTP